MDIGALRPTKEVVGVSPSVARRLLYAAATSSRLELVARSNRWIEQQAYRAASRYVAGRSLSAAIRTVSELVADGLAASLDLFGESVTDSDEVERVVRGYRDAAEAIRDLGWDVYLEIVPSHLGIDVSVDFCRRQAERIVEALPEGARLHISAEESFRTPSTIEMTISLAKAGAPVMQTVQANLRRSVDDADRLTEAGVPVRLVKGAYVEPRDVAHRWGEETEVAYIELAHRLHSGGREFSLGTHDAVIREALLAAFGRSRIEMLLGVREAEARSLVRRGHHVRIYVPYGNDWFRYWLRRAAEAQGV